MGYARYKELLGLIGESDAAMLVKWLLAPVKQHAANIAHRAYDAGLFKVVPGLTHEGRSFARMHMEQYLIANPLPDGASRDGGA